jgi:hypothetical protein
MGLVLHSLSSRKLDLSLQFAGRTMTEQYHLFSFVCEGTYSDGTLATREHDYIHQTEFEARREVIHALIGLYNFYPKKISLKQTKVWSPSPFFFD